jgi:putative ABC transport system substrate-binding protein
VILNPDNPANVATLRAMEDTARSVKIELQAIEVRRPEEFKSIFAIIVKGRAGALAVYDDAMLIAQAGQIADLARKNRLPTIGFIEYAKAGSLLGFGVNFPDLWRRAAGFVDKIFNGAKPSDLPVEQPTKFELVINLKSAKALGLTIPPSILQQADTVIE